MKNITRGAPWLWERRLNTHLHSKPCLKERGTTIETDHIIFKASHSAEKNRDHLCCKNATFSPCFKHCTSAANMVGAKNTIVESWLSRANHLDNMSGRELRWGFRHVMVLQQHARSVRWGFGGNGRKRHLQCNNDWHFCDQSNYIELFYWKCTSTSKLVTSCRQ